MTAARKLQGTGVFRSKEIGDIASSNSHFVTERGSVSRSTRGKHDPARSERRLGVEPAAGRRPALHHENCCIAIIVSILARLARPDRA